MKKRRRTLDIIAEIISNWKLYLEIDSVVDNADGTYTVLTCNTLYFQGDSRGEDRFVTIDDVAYPILAVDYNVSLTLSGTTPPTTGKKLVPVPFFFNGTITEQGLELSQEAGMSQKTPMIYLQRPFSEREDELGPGFTDIATEPDLILYFLTESDFTSTTAEIDTRCIKPMFNLKQAFFEYLKSSACAKFVDKNTVTQSDNEEMLRFGRATEEGYIPPVGWADHYSGYKSRVSFGIKYSCVCP